MIYGRRSHETPPHPRYQTLMQNHVHCIYLNELDADDESLGVGITKLFVETPKKTTSSAQKLINQVKEELSDERTREKMLAFIQAIVFYKFSNLSMEEIEAMLDLSEFKKSRLYQSMLKKTKLDVVPILLATGLSIQQVAKRLELDVEEVRKVAQQQ